MTPSRYQGNAMEQVLSIFSRHFVYPVNQSLQLRDNLSRFLLPDFLHQRQRRFQRRRSLGIDFRKVRIRRDI